MLVESPHLGWAALLAAVLMTLAVATGQAGASASEGPRGLIAFASNQTGDFEIFAMNADGTGAANLTNNAASDMFPTWSPDRSRIAFTRGGGLGREIYVMDADGTDQTPLTGNAVADVQPSWSPDGKRIAFVRFGVEGNREVWIMNADGSGEVRLTDDPAVDIRPDWSPNGKDIAFMSDRSGAEAIYTVRPDGSHLQKLTPDVLRAGVPSWSPNGKLIAFADNTCSTCDESDIFVMDARGNMLTQVTDTPDNDLDPDWSPDGDRIVFDTGTLVGDTFLPPDVIVVTEDGNRSVNLTNSPGVTDVVPDWAPDRAE